MNVGKYDLNETSILKFDPKVQEVALSTHDLQVYYGKKHAFFDGNLLFERSEERRGGKECRL